ncbi:MAG: Ig-like domain repeat protein, partial [Methanosphaera sp.]|nr:Ig-like domain repeat protein [Methanosphaera sp.]
NTTINNQGTLTITDDCIIGENCQITGNGQIIINDTNKIAPYLQTFNGNYTLENTTINTTKTNNQNLTIKNSNITAQITNNGNLTLSNTTINSTINNQGTLTITDDCIIGDNLIIGGEGEIIINDTNKIAPYLQTFNGNYTLENMTIDSIKINYGNLTIINSTINAYIGNGGNLIITNSTINAYMENYGTLIISDDTIIGDEFYLDNYGQLIMNDTTRVGIYSGNIIKDNTVINSSITIPNDGNVTFINSNITAPITNNGNLTFINSTIWAPITNRGNLIIDNSPVTNTTLKNYGNITVLNTTLNQTNISNSNTAELKIYNSTIYDSITGNPGGKTVEIYNTNFIGNAFAGTLTVNCSYMNGSTVTARGDVINCSFINNSRVDNRYYASNGGALTGTNLTVTNCIFINNGLYMNNDTGVSGGSGGAIAGTNLTVINCTFDSNYAQTKSSWIQCQGGGAISADGNINITNSTFKNNYVISPHGTIINGSTYFTVFETGMGGAILATGIATITNNQFINNSASINGSAIYLTGGTNKLHTITNNRFQDNNQAVETIYIRNYFEDIENKKLIYFDTPTNITDNNYSNNSIGFKTLTLNGPNKAYMGDQITITLDIELEHPEFYDEDILEQTQYTWYINGETNTNKETEKTITVGNENIITYVKPTISNTRTKVLAITPTILNDIIITPDNINNYVFEGELIVSANSRLIFQGEFNNIGEIYNNKNEVIFDGTNATFTNTAFIIEAQNNTLQNMNINNTDTSDYIITIIGSDNTIQNNTLNQYNSNDKTAAIYNNNGNNNKITQNTIKVSGPALAITYEAGATTANTQGILSVGGQNNTITYNMITVTNSTDSDQSQFGTIEAITAPQGTNNNISYNTIQCTGARFNYGINTLENVQGNSITYNNITVTGYRYTDGIQVGDGATGNLIANNNINLTCLNTTPVDEAAISYGVIITSQGGQISDNNTITQNNITINGAVNYGMEIYTSTNTFITENNISLTGVKSMGIGYAHSPNSIVTDNNITINDDSTGTLNSVTEEIQPLSTGIRIQQDSSNILIEHNTIITNDSQKQDTTINSEDNNITIKNNQLTSSQGYGDETINAPLTANKENNIIETTTTLAVPESIATNTAITLTATVTTADGTPINGGTVTFTKGNEAIAQTTVTDGIATATITFTQEEEDVTIVASYTPTSTGLSTSSAEAATSIQAPITQLNIAEIDMTAGETVTLTARVTDQNGNNINGGKVTFKVNGKTVKDASGKVIYAKVVDGVATAQYTVPDSLAGKDVNITASYSGSAKYNKESTTITKTVAAQEPTLTITPITDDVQTGSTITLKAKIAAGDKAITNGKIVFKINGKTVKDANGKVIYAHVDANGEVSIDYNLGNLKTGTYTIEATFIAPNYDKITSNTTMTVVKA